VHNIILILWGGLRLGVVCCSRIFIAHASCCRRWRGDGQDINNTTATNFTLAAYDICVWTKDCILP
jgi:hypothetical protein